MSSTLRNAAAGSLLLAISVALSGVSGYGTIEAADYFTHEGLEPEPDVVLIYYLENDNQSVPHVGGPVASLLKDWVVYRSYLFSTVLYAWRLNSWKLLTTSAVH